MTERPPMRFADPGRICIDVMPPARAVRKPGSCGQTECSAQTFGVVGEVASFPSALASTAGLGYTPRCEWTSINPGVTQRPVPSTVLLSAAPCRLQPTPPLLPPTTTTSP